MSLTGSPRKPLFRERLGRGGTFAVAAQRSLRRDELCEVYDTDCIWSQAYERLKAYGESDAMLDGPVVVKDALDRTSAWAKTFLGREYNTRRDLPS